MREFLKENYIRILVIVLLSLFLILGGQIMVFKFSQAACRENLETLDDRVRCARSLGWEIDKTSEVVKNVYIPKEFTQELLEYNEMQKMCGFDISAYMGKSAQVYTYRITNFPSSNPVNAFLNLIIYNDKMIGGDCDVLEYDDLYLPVILGKTNADIARRE